MSMTRTSRVVLLDNEGAPSSFAWSEEYKKKKKTIPLSYDSFFYETKLSRLLKARVCCYTLTVMYRWIGCSGTVFKVF